MVVQFFTVRGDVKESFDKEMMEGMGSKPDFENVDDYITEAVIDMEDVMDFVSGRIYCNGDRYDCIYPTFHSGRRTIALLCSYQQFKEIFEMSNEKKIVKHSVVKLQLKDRNNEINK